MCVWDLGLCPLDGVEAITDGRIFPDIALVQDIWSRWGHLYYECGTSISNVCRELHTGKQTRKFSWRDISGDAHAPIYMISFHFLNAICEVLVQGKIGG